MADLENLDFGDGGGSRTIVDANSVHSISVNGVPQTVTDKAVNLDVANNLITEAQWTAISNKY